MSQRDEPGDRRDEARRSGERPENDTANPAGGFPWEDASGGSQMHGPPQSSSGSPPQYGFSQPVTGWVTLGTGERAELAEPITRLGAKVIDWLLFWVVALVVILPISVVAGRSGFGIVFLLFLMCGVIGLLYDPVMIAVKGQTVGKMATRIRVARSDDGQLPGWGKSIGRWAIPGVLALIPIIGFILAIVFYVSLTWDGSRQGWHDKAAGTVVIKV